jgi:hypothetical protein
VEGQRPTTTLSNTEKEAAHEDTELWRSISPLSYPFNVNEVCVLITDFCSFFWVCAETWQLLQRKKMIHYVKAFSHWIFWKITSEDFSNDVFLALIKNDFGRF